VLLHLTSVYFRVFSLPSKMSRHTHRTMSCMWWNYLFGSSFKPDRKADDKLTHFRIGHTHPIHVHCSMWTCKLFCTQFDVSVLDILWITQMKIMSTISSHTFLTVFLDGPFTTWIYHSHEGPRIYVGKSILFQFAMCILIIIWKEEDL
jgi:hypothetical protein